MGIWDGMAGAGFGDNLAILLGMGGSLERMPLFPLKTVLFPYAALQLRVFEERYKEMMRYCTEEDCGFGVVLIREGEEVGGNAVPFLVGTAVRIERTETFEDGTMQVLVKGERRFRIRRTDESYPFLMGLVEPVIELEPPDDPKTTALVHRTKELLMDYLTGYFSRYELQVRTVELGDDPTVLSFLVANLIRTEERRRQYLLELTDTVERLSELLPLLEEQVITLDEGFPHVLGKEDLLDWISRN